MAFIRPAPIHSQEECLAEDGHDRNFIEDSIHPKSSYINSDISFLDGCTRLARYMEFHLDLLFRSETVSAKEVEIVFRKVRAVFAQPFLFTGLELQLGKTYYKMNQKLKDEELV